MGLFLQYLFSGLSQGSLYALVALGLVLVYRSNRVLNFAHGDITTTGAFIAYGFIMMGLSWWLSAFLALLAGAALSVIFYFLVLTPALRREATHLGQVILTLGFGLIFQGLILWLGFTDPQEFPFPLSDSKVFHFGEVIISHLSLGTLITGILGSLIFYLLIQKTRIGLAMRATSENLPAAQTLGIPTRPILALSWGLAALLGVLAGLFLAAALLIDPFFMAESFPKGFAAAVLGGMNSIPGAIVGGLILGVVESLFGGFISVAFKSTLAFLIIIIVLLLRPEGLLGKEFIERV
ncbi:branched-chain amino acid ABC transporter permease [Thermodesulfobacteriota bacterium]